MIGLWLSLLALGVSPAEAQFWKQAPRVLMYRQVGEVKLGMDVYVPPDLDTTRRYPAMVFFHGGGWTSGTRRQFMGQAQYFAERGMVTFLVDYRVGGKHSRGIQEAMEDARAAMRYIRTQADRFCVDPDVIVAVGGSAGGQLALSTTFLGPNGTPPALIQPQALILFNPALDLGPDNHRAYEVVGEDYPQVSPLHNVHAHMPPVLIMHGEEDPVIPVSSVMAYQEALTQLGNESTLDLFPGQSHGFFNPWISDAYFRATVETMDYFLVKLGFLQGPPTIREAPLPPEGWEIPVGKRG